MIDWDDLRVFLAVARGGGLSAAARTLKVNHSTVFRRIQALESRLGVLLFDRRANGYVLTSAGEEMLGSAGRMEQEAIALDLRLTGRDLELGGTIRLTTPDDLAFWLLMPALAEFRARYPGIQLEVIVDNRMADLTRREADVAIRSTRQPPETMVGLRIGDIAVAVYGAAGAAPPEDLATVPWVAFEEGMGATGQARWMAEMVPGARVVYRSNSLLNQLGAVRVGIGLAVLPCFMGDGDAGLVRLSPAYTRLSSQLWLLTHPDLRRAARVGAFMDFMGEALRRRRPLLEGTGAPPAA